MVRLFTLSAILALSFNSAFAKDVSYSCEQLRASIDSIKNEQIELGIRKDKELKSAPKRTREDFVIDFQRRADALSLPVQILSNISVGIGCAQ